MSLLFELINHTETRSSESKWDFHFPPVSVSVLVVVDEWSLSRAQTGFRSKLSFDNQGGFN